MKAVSCRLSGEVGVSGAAAECTTSLRSRFIPGRKVVNRCAASAVFPSKGPAFGVRGRSGHRRHGQHRTATTVQAHKSSSDRSLGPYRPSSEVGKYMHELMDTYPEQFVTAVVQQLEKLEVDEEDAVEPPPRFEDAMLKELHGRVQDLKRREKQLEKQSAVEDLMYLCVVMCFSDLGLKLTPSLYDHEISRLLVSNAEADKDSEELLGTHDAEASQLVKEYIRQLTHDTEPIAVGSYQMRMPPMVGNSTIAIPYVFLSQMYDSAVRFGYSLKRAQQIQDLDRSLSVYSPASTTNDDGLIQTRTTEIAPVPLIAYLYRDGEKPSTIKMGSDAAGRVCKLQTDGLFGAYEMHSSQMERALQASTSVEDAQWRLDQAMCTESISWMNLSLAGIERLLLEAITFGRILWDVESTFGIEYHLL
uniref:Uncharacterized protein n=1 Tax=Pyramimonas obovata TaxID=1411642 RepID=A0A7S0R015_9CHLO|mmetsp:Transcript_21051/g.46168  ORF Transcript_21051/g.46168 Transcript_21051/m.46168 type:complete len:418 (+) Transcript_21051:195-1448(+)|eukprot:CAMPEP_0118935078 /NCGR_PEP_ID=MMETSP1169-20130426/14866_1 /TAXON_ID=36882 /ORGANISM="Pyramimonas obovata, Strain CCMP722" /LENGTH=417 /DNA_ID=CAMNT_0006878061 /DNA_START=191 /DNA_END=1444 /DNA_ORIENTATION=-